MNGIQRLIIMLDEDGKVKLNGPLQNKLLCYGLLEVARDIIKDHKVVIPVAAIPPGINLKPQS